MQKISSIIAVMAGFLMFFASCTNEELVPNEPDGPVLNQGRVVFNVNTGKSIVYTRASKEDEQAIRSLGVFIVKPDGNLAEGVTRFYEAKDLIDKKLAVSIPTNIMETSGVKAYLVANGPDKAQCDGIKTGQEVIDLVATTKPEEISTKGIPMACGAISLNFTGGIATVDANMKRVMSTLCATVIKGAVVGLDDFTFTVHGVSGKEGYCFKDECKDTGVDQVWSPTSKTPGEEVSLGYFYQSKGFQVEVTSKSTGQSRTVEIPLEKAQTRNKKYVLKIHPNPVSEGKGEFKVTVEEWKSIEIDIEEEILHLRTDMPIPKYQIDEDWVLVLSPTNALYTDFGDPKEWFKLKEGAKIVDVELKNVDSAVPLVINKDGHLCLEGTLDTGKGETLIFIIEGKNGIRFIETFQFGLYATTAYWQRNYTWSDGTTSVKIVDNTFEFTNLKAYGKEIDFPFYNVLTMPEGAGDFQDMKIYEPSSQDKTLGVLRDAEGNIVPGIGFKAKSQGGYPNGKLYFEMNYPNTNVWGEVIVNAYIEHMVYPTILKVYFR